MRLPKALQNLIDSFERLPGIGPKTAARLAFYLWQTPNHFVENFARTLIDLKKNIRQCPVCFNLDEVEPCSICSETGRDQSLVCVVEKPLDIVALEKMEAINGVYHCLGGVINPLERIGPEDLRIRELLSRIKSGKIKELILATNPTMEGEATAMYIARKVRELTPNQSTAHQDKSGTRRESDARQEHGSGQELKITRLGQGLPTGADLDYADAWTLKQAWENRREVEK
ncbi:MAG: recombination mediator RecR [Patescibacteria group bacterium]|nr:recombination mediator RecR [Patescibacteria group bacterium]